MPAFIDCLSCRQGSVHLQGSFALFNVFWRENDATVTTNNLGFLIPDQTFSPSIPACNHAIEIEGKNGILFGTVYH
jgi:hypothetical protein